MRSTVTSAVLTPRTSRSHVNDRPYCPTHRCLISLRIRWAVGSVVTGRVRHRPGADQAHDDDQCRHGSCSRRRAPPGPCAASRPRPVLAFDHFTVQRASRSFCASLAGLSAPPGRDPPSLMSRFSASVFRCFGAAMMEASNDSGSPSPGSLPESRLASSAPKQHLDRRPAPSVARVSASRNVQIVFASGTGSATRAEKAS